jgi:hypothetical protein
MPDTATQHNGIAAWWELRLRERRMRSFRAEVKRLRMSAGHLRCELFLAYLKAADLFEANEMKEVADRLVATAAEILTSEDF